LGGGFPGAGLPFCGGYPGAGRPLVGRRTGVPFMRAGA
jgi:hypothetical protein